MVVAGVTVATALFLRVSRVDRQRAAADFRAVELRNGLLSILVVYVDKCEALRLSWCRA
jgi:hypothetical protein